MSRRNHIHLFSPLLVVLFCGSTFAAKPVRSPVIPDAQIEFAPVAQTWYGLNETTSARSTEAAAREYLAQHSDRFGGLETVSSLEFVCEKASPAGRHLWFRQTVNGIPVYRGEVRVHMDSERRIKAITSTVQPVTLRRSKVTVSESDAIQVALRRLGEARSDTQPYADQVVLINHETGDGEIVWRVRLSSANPLGDWELLVDGISGDILHIDNRLAFENGQGLVFNPDPLTTAEVLYGDSPNYMDNEDADTAELNAERVPVLLHDLTFREGAYRLEGPYVEIVDFEPPEVAPVSSPSLNGFAFTRSENGFEDVSAYYHIDAMQRHLQNLGFFNLQNGPIAVDAHASHGEDQSYYSPEFNRLSFGEGGVDDAEDADVLRHEYGHALHHDAVGGEVSGYDVRAIAEGICDYWAATMSARTSEFNDDWVYNWDGHNEFWHGRQITTTDIFPDNWLSGIYTGGTIWAHALWLMRGQMDPDDADALVAQSLYYMTSGVEVVSAAQAMLQVEEDLFDHQYRTIVWQAFIDKGFLYEAGSVEGFITDELTSDPIEGATVEIPDTDLSTTTNGLGYYHLDWVPAGMVELQVSNPGYASETEQVEIAWDETATLDLTLTPTVASLEINSLNLHTYFGSDEDSTFNMNATQDGVDWTVRAIPVDAPPVQEFESHDVITPVIPNVGELRGITCAGNHYYITDNGGTWPQIRVVDFAGTQVRSFTFFTTETVTGLASDGVSLFVEDAGAIIELDTLGNWIDFVPAPITDADWLAYDPQRGHLWQAHGDGRLANVTAGQLVDTELPLAGIGFDPGAENGYSLLLLVQDGGSEPRVVRMNPETFELGASTVLTNPVPLNVHDMCVFTGMHDDVDYLYLAMLAGEFGEDQIHVRRVRWTIPYLSFTPSIGSLNSGETAQIQANVASHVLDTGFYEATIQVFFPSGGVPLELPFTLRVTAVNAPSMDPVQAPTSFHVAAPSPNPCNASTVLEMTLPYSGMVDVAVYDILGRQVDRITQHLAGGTQRLVWSPGSTLASGVYLMKVNVADQPAVLRKVVLVK